MEPWRQILLSTPGKNATPLSDIMEQHNEPIYRTSPARTGKMLAIMCCICLAGGILFFSFWDYWISLPPGNQMHKAGEQKPTQGAVTGKEFDVEINFIESADFKSYAFNALPGEEGNNPEVHANVGDKVEFVVTNNGKSFHAFGVTDAAEGVEGIIAGTEVNTANNPLKPGQGGKSSFVPTKEGTYYYICTVPGHRALGMEGKIIVEPASAAPQAAAPTGISQNFDLNFIESADFKSYAFNALPGEEGNNPEIKVKSGDSVTITAANHGKSFHAFAVVSDADDPNTVVFSSAIKSANNPMKPGESGEVTFIAGAPGSYHYICTVPGHAALGMKGNFIVE
jgi:nitrite reductase (NO-forming)